MSRTEAVGAIRGLHLQASPHSEAKLVRCLRGRVWDVAVDLRPVSTSYGQCHAVELSPERANALLIPEGCAWAPEAETGVRWDDPQLSIGWPLPAGQLSERDRCLPWLAPQDRNSILNQGIQSKRPSLSLWSLSDQAG